MNDDETEREKSRSGRSALHAVGTSAVVGPGTSRVMESDLRAQFETWVGRCVGWWSVAETRTIACQYGVSAPLRRSDQRVGTYAGGISAKSLLRVNGVEHVSKSRGYSKNDDWPPLWDVAMSDAESDELWRLGKEKNGAAGLMTIRNVRSCRVPSTRLTHPRQARLQHDTLAFLYMRPQAHLLSTVIERTRAALLLSTAHPLHHHQTDFRLEI